MFFSLLFSPSFHPSENNSKIKKGVRHVLSLPIPAPLLLGIFFCRASGDG
jgi:hypothetical protein